MGDWELVFLGREGGEGIWNREWTLLRSGYGGAGANGPSFACGYGVAGTNFLGRGGEEAQGIRLNWRRAKAEGRRLGSAPAGEVAQLGGAFHWGRRRGWFRGWPELAKGSIFGSGNCACTWWLEDSDLEGSEWLGLCLRRGPFGGPGCKCFRLLLSEMLVRGPFDDVGVIWVSRRRVCNHVEICYFYRGYGYIGTGVEGLLLSGSNCFSDCPNFLI